MIPRVLDRRIVTYGLSPQADVRAMNLEASPAGAAFDVVITRRPSAAVETIDGVRLPMLGEHNVQNALAAIAVGVEMGLEGDTIRATLARFSGVKRRFTKTGTAAGVTVIDDYGHHPVEIAAVLRAARTRVTTGGRVVAVVQPHRYSRLHGLFEDFCTCFNDADAVVVADVYAAGEQPIEGADRDHLIEGLRTHGHRLVMPLTDPGLLPQLVKQLTRPGDLVVCLGAGNITAWAQSLPSALAALDDRRPQAKGASA